MDRPRNEQERQRLLEELRRQFFLPPLIEHRYTIQQVIGEGSYGVVCSATDRASNQKVAVKRIMRVFEEAPEATRTLRELKFLRLLRDHENIITIKDVLLPSERDRFDDVFVVLELMPTDLTRVLRSNIVLSNEHIRWLIYQLLRGIHYLHSANVFHRDLKPANILINASCDLRIIDFGLARLPLSNHRDAQLLTDYVATRWYRAPELILLGSLQYTAAIDMWSVACIFGEMLNSGRPIFPGLNNYNQIERIIDVCGPPNEEMLSAMRNSPMFIPLVPKTTTPPSRTLQQLLPQANPLALDLLSKLLELDPSRRLTAAAAMEHPYFAQLHEPSSAITRSAIPPEEFAFETKQLSVDQLRRLFLEEILRYHPDKREQYLGQSPQPTRRLATEGQAARFRDAMIAVQGGTDQPRPWDSMPNHTLTNYFNAAVNSTTGSTTTTGAANTASTIPEENRTNEIRTTADHPANTTRVADMNYATSNGQMAATRQEHAWTTNHARATSNGNCMDSMSNGMEDVHQMSYAGLASVESATSAMGIRRVSETVDSLMETEVDK